MTRRRLVELGRFEGKQLFVIQTMSLTSSSSASGFVVNASLYPVAIILATDGDVEVFDCEGVRQESEPWMQKMAGWIELSGESTARQVIPLPWMEALFSAD